MLHRWSLYTLFTNGRQPGTSTRPNMESRRFRINTCFRANFDQVTESSTEESFTVSSNITSEADDTVSLETAEIVNTESNHKIHASHYDFSVKRNR